jgi:hypothetical protein
MQELIIKLSHILLDIVKSIRSKKVLKGASLAGSNHRDPNTPLTEEELLIIEQRLSQMRQEMGIEYGVASYRNLQKILDWYHANFHYQSDAITFGKDDFWNTMAFSWYILDGTLWDDCDSGYALIEAIERIIGLDSNTERKRIRRVSCKTETGEGHFVVWVKADDDIWYQVENRIRIVRTVKYMRDFGYQFWHYSNMSAEHINTNKWFDAEKEAARICYETPSGLASDKKMEDMTTEEVISAVPESRTLQFGTGVGGTTLTGAVIALANQADWKIVLMFLVAGLIVAGGIFYFRLITIHPVKYRRGA